MDRHLLEQPIFYEAAYRIRYPDAAMLIDANKFRSGKDHWDRIGKSNNYEAEWVIPLDLDFRAYFMHYPDAKKFVENEKDPDVTSAAAHFRRYGNQQGLFFFMRGRDTGRYEGLPPEMNPEIQKDKILEFEQTTDIKHVPVERNYTKKATLRRVNKVAIITTFYNPVNYRRPFQNMLEFRAELEKYDVDLFLVELAFDEDPFVIDDAFLQIRGTRKEHQLWQKERLMNIALEKLPDDYDAIGWFDCDILFRNKDWLAESLDGLCKYTWLQPFSGSWFVERDGTLSNLKNSCSWYYHNKPELALSLDKAHPGFAWIARADWIRKFKFCDTNITGGGDALMLKATTEKPLYIETYLNTEWLDDIYVWSSLAREGGGRHVGNVSGDILHLYHGERENRLYLLRWHYLSHYGFDPNKDIEVDPETGLWRWTHTALHEKEEMVSRVKGYFSQRKEDG